MRLPKRIRILHISFHFIPFFTFFLTLFLTLFTLFLNLFTLFLIFFTLFLTYRSLFTLFLFVGSFIDFGFTELYVFCTRIATSQKCVKYALFYVCEIRTFVKLLYVCVFHEIRTFCEVAIRMHISHTYSDFTKDPARVWNRYFWPCTCVEDAFRTRAGSFVKSLYVCKIRMGWLRLVGSLKW